MGVAALSRGARERAGDTPRGGEGKRRRDLTGVAESVEEVNNASALLLPALSEERRKRN